MRKVLVFGVFDGLHDGHRSLLEQAKACGEYLIAVVARDMVAEELKESFPCLPVQVRIEHLRGLGIADEVVSGDKAQGTYEVVRKYKPDVIALGYDQERLKNDLEKRRGEFNWNIELKVMEPYKPEKFHSSIVNSH
jgi:cytidyltransferase-like protein